MKHSRYSAVKISFTRREKARQAITSLGLTRAHVDQLAAVEPDGNIVLGDPARASAAKSSTLFSYKTKAAAIA